MPDEQTTQEQSQALAYPRCYIQAGYVTYSLDPACICGVCGNGVIVTLYDPVSRCGGMAHCVFPDADAGRKRQTNYHSFTALSTLYAQLRQGRGAAPAPMRRPMR